MTGTARASLLEQLDRYQRCFPEDLVRVDHVRQFVRVHEDCFERSCREGHLTGSAWVVSHDRAQVLLVHHRKLDRWLQPGGHADGETDLRRVALREAVEETGIPGLRLVDGAGGGVPLPLDVDVHRIPPHGDDPAHLHLDFRYLVEAPPGARPEPSEESHDARWFPRAEALALASEEGLRRLAERAGCGAFQR